MAKLNKKPDSIKTHEGGPAKRINSELQLRRSVMACMLWEDQFYEDGESIADRIKSNIPLVEPEKVAQIAVEAREKMKLRHVPLLIVREMARLKSHKHLVSKTLSRIIQRADELAEFLAIYWKDGRQPVSSQVKRGLASAFTKFYAYDLAKYNRDGQVKLRDVLFISHPKPRDNEQKEIWKKLVNGTLESPDTWEVALSSGADKKESWERLILDGKLGALALLRNLRNMEKAGVDENIIFSALDNMKTERVLPFRFISAARYAPQWESKIEKPMLKCLEGKEVLRGKTVLLIDVSGSMESLVSGKSEISRMDAACGLGILLRELAETVAIYTFSYNLVRVADRRGFALRDAIVKSQEHGGTYLGQAIKYINEKEKFDRLIVITDEQAHDSVGGSNSKGYMINIASYKNGVGYGNWVHIDGWSESIIDYIKTFEEKD